MYFVYKRLILVVKPIKDASNGCSTNIIDLFNIEVYLAIKAN